MKDVKEVSRRDYKGYTIIKGIGGNYKTELGTYKISWAVTPEGHYIGDSKRARFICETRGIKPELTKFNDKVCSIGFCEKERRWFGWSHRAILGFGVGSEVKKGNPAYVPTDPEDARLNAIRFWSESSHTEVDAVLVEKTDVDDAHFHITWKYVSDEKLLPNTKLHGTIGNARYHFDGEYGNGEWTARTLSEAKRMAVDFARGVC